MLGGRAKEIKLPNSLPKVDNVQREKCTAAKSIKKTLSKNAKHSQLKSKGSPINVASLDAQQPRENALKGSADYSALIQKARTQHLLRKYFTRTT